MEVQSQLCPVISKPAFLREEDTQLNKRRKRASCSPPAATGPAAQQRLSKVTSRPAPLVAAQKLPARHPGLDCSL